LDDAQAEEVKPPAESIIQLRRNIEAAITNSKIETKEINDQQSTRDNQTSSPFSLFIILNRQKLIPFQPFKTP
jgi:hypothetical protein